VLGRGCGRSGHAGRQAAFGPVRRATGALGRQGAWRRSERRQRRTFRVLFFRRDIRDAHLKHFKNGKNATFEQMGRYNDYYKVL
jgi:hypothetical protein